MSRCSPCADVALDLYEGEIAVLLGPSGGGKSTLLNIMGGLDRVTTGTVRFRGEELTTFSERQLTRFRRDHVGFVFQFYNLIPSLTAWENVALVTEISSNPMKPDEALKMVGLKDRMVHFPAQLSGGEQQRVAIARAIAKRPEVVADQRGNEDDHGDHHAQCRHPPDRASRLHLQGRSHCRCRRQRPAGKAQLSSRRIGTSIDAYQRKNLS